MQETQASGPDQDTQGRFSRAGAALFALLSGLSLIFGVLWILASGSTTAGQDVAIISQRGEEVDVTAHLAAGRYTLIDFYADWCRQCVEMEPWLLEQVRSREDLVMRKVNVLTWDTPVAKQYGLTFLPYLLLYGPDGGLVAQGAEAVLEELRRQAS